MPMNSDLMVVEKSSQIDLITKIKYGDAEESYFGTKNKTPSCLSYSNEKSGKQSFDST